jgi:predicted DNA-binding transcriptional regulator AlpA
MAEPAQLEISINRIAETPIQERTSEDRSVSYGRKPPKRATELEPLLTAEDVARRLNVSTDWVWDHSSRKKPLLPVIRMGDGALRYRASGIEAFIDERERLSSLRRRA